MMKNFVNKMKIDISEKKKIQLRLQNKYIKN